MFGELERIW